MAQVRIKEDFPVYETYIYRTLVPSAVISSINTSDTVPLTAKDVHAIALPSPCLMEDVVCFGSMSCYFSSPY